MKSNNRQKGSINQKNEQDSHDHAIKPEHENQWLQPLYDPTIDKTLNQAALLKFDRKLLERSHTQWQFGDWLSLSLLAEEPLENHPDRAKLAILAASGLLQQGSNDSARKFVRLAKQWGCEKNLVSQVLIGGVYNTLGKAAIIIGQQRRAMEYFEKALRTSMPGGDESFLAYIREQRQLAELVYSKISANSYLLNGPPLRILIMTQTMRTGGVQQYTLDLVKSFRDYDITIYSSEEIPEWRKKELSSITKNIKIVGDEDVFCMAFDQIYLNSWPVDFVELRSTLHSLKRKNPICKVLAITHTDIHKFNKSICDIIDEIDAHITVSLKCTNKISQLSGKDITSKTYLLQPCLSAENKMGAPPTKRLSKKIAYAGRAVPVKGVHFLIELFSRFMDENPSCDYTLHVCAPFSDESYFQTAKSFIPEESERKNVIIENKTMFREDLAEFIAGADYLVYTSAMDGLPYTFLESMSRGTPVISTNVGGISRLINHRQNGYLLNFPGLFVPSLEEKTPYLKLVQLFEKNKEKYYSIFSEIMGEALYLKESQYQLISQNAYRDCFHRFSFNNFKLQAINVLHDIAAI